MRDEHHGAGEALDGLFEHLERGDVEVVGGFVQHQDVGGLEHHGRNVRAGALAAGEARDGLQELRVLEEELAAPRGDVHGAALEVHLVAERADGVAQQGLRRDVRALLAEHHDARLRIGKLHRTGIGRQVTAEDGEQRGLAAAVRAHEAEAIAGRQLKLHVLEERAPLESLGDAGGLHQAARLAAAGGEIHARAAGVGRGVAVGQVLELLAAVGAVLDAALRLGAPRLGTTREPRVVHAHLVGERGLALGLRFQELVAAAEELGVVPFHGERALRVRAAQLHHARGHAIEEGAVVRDEDAGAGADVVGAAGEELLEPADPFHVEVVGGLVKQQEVRRAARLAQAAGDGKALLPAAREALHRLVHARFREAELPEDHAAEHLGLVVVAVDGDGLHGGGGGRGARREAGREVVALRHVDDHRAALGADGALVRLLGAGQHAQERGLARAVRADEAHAIAVGDAQAHAVEEFAQAVGLGEIGGDEEHGGPARRARGRGS